ncbi:hypothetical protein [Kitasatospora sp. NPDC008115]|uniref:hypothetical protein n=1 Tax=Kitasatospora sp. NPDC008115 TaxID=3364022 RepID=UPI0036EEF02A
MHNSPTPLTGRPHNPSRPGHSCRLGRGTTTGITSAPLPAGTGGTFSNRPPRTAATLCVTLPGNGAARTPSSASADHPPASRPSTRTA